MTQPAPYDPAYSFADFASGAPSSQPPGVKLDDEYNAIAQSIADILTNLALIQRDDTRLRNGSVGVDQLDETALALIASPGFAVKGPWVTATSYILGDLVNNGGLVYLVTVAHTSGVLATDIAAAKLTLVFDPGNVALATSLALSTGAGTIGATGGITVQAALNLKQSIATLLANGGAATIGTAAGVTVEAALALKMTIAAMVATSGSANVGHIASGTDPLARTSQAKHRSIVSDGDFISGLVPALTAVRNLSDAAFSGSVYLEPGVVDLASSAALQASFNRIFGFQLSAAYRAPAGVDVFSGAGAAMVNSKFEGFRTYSGRDVFAITTAGEIASLDFRNLAFSQFNRDAFSFAGGVTSCSFSQIKADTSAGRYGIYSAGGINNDNLVEDCDFTGLTDSAIRSRNLTQGWVLRMNRVEGGGVNGKSVYDLEGVAGCRLIEGWHEGHHETLVKLSGSSEDGLLIDGIVDIGAKDGVGFKASLFDCGTNRVLFGTNLWNYATTAPAKVFLFGVNANLLTNASLVYTKDTKSEIEAYPPLRSFASAPSLTFDLVSVTRPNTGAASTNQQTLCFDLDIPFQGLDGGGVGRSGWFKYQVIITGSGNATISSSINPATAIGNLGAITCTVQLKAGATAGAATVEVVFAGVLTSQPNGIRPGIRARNMSIVEGDRFVVTFP